MKDPDIEIQNNQKSKLKTEIWASWMRSKGYNVDPNTSLLPPRLPKQLVEPLISDYLIYSKSLDVTRLEREFKLLDSIGAVVFYLSDDLTIIIGEGNDQLMNKLKSINLGYRSNLAESKVGTNAASLAALTQKEKWVIGAEHYHQAMKDLACVATPLNEDLFGKLYIMYVIPVDEFTPKIKNLLSYLIMTARVVSTNWHPELHIKNELVNLSMEQSNTGMIILDAKGIISSVNQKISTLFRMTPQMMCGKKLNTIIPELSELAHCFENGQALPRRKIKLNSISNSKPYYMDCQPIMKGDQRLGSVIFISDKKDTEAIVKHFITKAAHFNFNDLIGNNPDFLATKKLAKDYAQSESNLLIIGESGTGKELFAHSIHNASNRKDGPFVSINCAAIPRELLCSELFGYVEGSFTGANKAGAYGKFELAHNGTLFLDEIADMPIDMQSILLKAIEEKSFFKLGDSSPTPVDVRIIAATNKDLWQLVKEGSFRQDLYFRLNVLKLELIPLRNRPDDIPLLIDYFSKQYRNLDNQVITFAPEAMDIFFKYHWPGNVRQLRNVIERCANQNTSSTISIYDLPKEIITMQSGESILNGDNSTAKLIHGLKKELDFSEKQIIKDLMLKFKGNKSRVAEELGIARTTLYRKLKDMNWDYK